MRRASAIAALFLLGAGFLPAQGSPSPLSILPGDLRIEAREDGGYDLYIRKKPGIGSVLLTESTKDPAMKADNYAYRAAEYNPVNGDERRMLDGKLLPASGGLYSLISSTGRTDPELGEAFRVLIPPVLVYGYPWSRSGTVAVGMGTYINIRAFAKPYADYSGAFLDNPYQISMRSIPIASAPPAEAERQEPGIEAEADDTSSRIAALIPTAGRSLDLVICLDTTDSMKPYIDEVKRSLSPLVRRRTEGFESFRIGVVLYRDYWPDDYITLKMPFTSDIEAFDRFVGGVTVFGGMDIPEAVYEAVHSAATEFDWKADVRQIIILGDAPPHLAPKGKIGFAQAAAEAASRRIAVDALIEPVDFPKGASAAALKAASEAGPASRYANASRVLAFAVAGGASCRVIAMSGDEAELKALAAELPSELPADPLLSFMGARRLKAGSSRAEAIAAAKAAGATHLALATASSYPAGGDALREIKTVLIEVATGRIAATDTAFSTLSSTGRSSLFRNGKRVK